MDKGEWQGWYPDPFELHEIRYFSAGRPTQLVRDGDVESYDHPPSEASWPSAAELAAAGPSSSGPGSGGAYSGSGMPGSGTTPYPRDADIVSVPPKRRHRLAVASTAAIAVGAVVLLMVMVGRSGSPPASRSIVTSPAAFVTTSAQRTLSQQTAEFTVSGAAHALGQTIPMRGNGEINFSTNSMVLNLYASSSGHTVVEHELAVGGDFYLGSPDLARLTAGRHWIRLPLVQSGSENLTGGNPISLLSLLERQGSSIKSLGTQTIDGVSCRGYAVTLSRQAMLAGARQELARLGLSADQKSAMLHLVQSIQPPTVTVWFDSSQLMRQMSVGLQLGGVTGSGSVGGQVIMDFTHYGVPVDITAPAPSDTISYQQFMKTAF